MSNETKHRSHLPMPNTVRPRSIAYDAKDPDSKLPPIEQLRPPQGAPNVLIVLIDDAGFGSSSAFGGPCQTPSAEALAAGGLKYDRFHTTALCSPKGAEGVIISQGANIGGWSLYAKDGKLKYCYNWGGFKNFFVEATTPIPPGEHQVRMEFAYAGGGLGKGGKATLFVDGKKVGEGEIGATLAMVFSADDGCDVGVDSGAPVSPDYGAQGNAFNGKVNGVQLAIADAAENLDHLISPEVAVHLAMARQ